VIYSYRKWGRPRDLMVRIPPGISSGQSIRLGGMGAPGRSGGRPGDLYLKVRVKTPWPQRIRSFFRLAVLALVV
jgi:DnaJ-class molecular chaperone